MILQQDITIYKLNGISKAIGGEGSAIANQHMYWSDQDGLILSKDIVTDIRDFTSGNLRLSGEAMSIYVGQTKYAEYGRTSIIGRTGRGQSYLTLSDVGLTLMGRNEVAAFQVNVGRNKAPSSTVWYVKENNVPETAVNGRTRTLTYDDEYFTSVSNAYIRIVRGEDTITLSDEQATLSWTVNDGIVTLDYAIADDVLEDPVEGETVQIYTYISYTAYCPSITLGTRREGDTEGSYSVAAGYDNSAGGDNSLALGYRCRANGYTGIAMGYNCEARFSHSVSIGRGLETSRTRQIVLGAWNETDEDAIFIVGDGTSETAKSNIFWIDANKVVHIAGDLVVSGTVTSGGGGGE